MEIYFFRILLIPHNNMPTPIFSTIGIDQSSKGFLIAPTGCIQIGSLIDGHKEWFLPFNFDGCCGNNLS